MNVTHFLYRIVPNFEDLGGNRALGNDGCNGIFVLASQQCLSFISPPSVIERSNPSQHPSSFPTIFPLKPTPKDSTSCRINSVQRHTQNCLPVKSFNDFRRTVSL